MRVCANWGVCANRGGSWHNLWNGGPPRAPAFARLLRPGITSRLGPAAAWLLTPVANPGIPGSPITHCPLNHSFCAACVYQGTPAPFGATVRAGTTLRLWAQANVAGGSYGAAIWAWSAVAGCSRARGGEKIENPRQPRELGGPPARPPGCTGSPAAGCAHAGRAASRAQAPAGRPGQANPRGVVGQPNSSTGLHWLAGCWLRQRRACVRVASCRCAQREASGPCFPPRPNGRQRAPARLAPQARRLHRAGSGWITSSTWARRARPPATV